MQPRLFCTSLPIRRRIQYSQVANASVAARESWWSAPTARWVASPTPSAPEVTGGLRQVLHKKEGRVIPYPPWVCLPRPNSIAVITTVGGVQRLPLYSS